MRTAEITRSTKETNIRATLNLDKPGYEIDSGIGFFDHMLCAFSQHGKFGLTLQAKGDLEVDMHHTVEDCGIVLGQAFAKALADKVGIERFARSDIPMDEALATCTVDVSGRPFLVFDAAPLEGQSIQGFDPMLLEEFFRAFAINAGVTLHLSCPYGKNAHHIAEAIFKAVGRALSAAVKITGDAVPSSKGIL